MRLIDTCISVCDTDTVTASFKPLAKEGYIVITDSGGCVVRVEMHREQAERLLKAIESELMDETSESMENRLIGVINKLEGIIEGYKQRVEQDRQEGVEMFDHRELR